MHSAWFRSIFPRVLKFLQIKEGGDLISESNQFSRKSELFGHPFCISILKGLWSQIFCHSLDLDAFHLIQEYFSQSPEISANETGGPNFWGEPILQKVCIIWSPLLYFNFKSFMEPNSWSLIRFQCIVHDSWVLFSESWNFYKLKRGDQISG